MLGCDITEEKAPDATVLSEIGNNLCKNTELKLDRLLEEDMSHEIDCLEKTIEDFYKSVQTKEKNVVNKSELGFFIKKYSNTKTDVDKGIELLYMFNHMFHGDTPGTIAKGNFISIINILRGFNKNIVNVFPMLNEVEETKRALRYRDEKEEKIKKITWDLHRERRQKVKEYASKIKDVFQAQSKTGRKSQDSINLIDLINNFERADTLNEKIREVVDFSDATIKSLKETILTEKDDLQAYKKILAAYALTDKQAQKLVPLIKNHVPDGNEEMMERLKSLLFLKRIVLGGDKEILTSTQFEKLIDILPDFVLLSFDLISMPYIDFKGELKLQFEMLTEDLGILIDNIYFNAESREVMFSIPEIIRAADKLKIKLADNYLSQIEKSVMNGKNMILGGDKRLVTANEFHHLMDMVYYAIKMVRYGYDIYDAHEEMMKLPFALGDRYIKELQKYPATEEEKPFRERFIRIVGSMRLFKGKKDFPFYSNELIRNPEGVMEAMLLEYVLGFAFNYYNNFSASIENHYKLSVGKAEILDVMDKIDDFLAINDLKPSKPERTADTARLVTDLFQTQSNGNSKLDLNEGLEFIYQLRDSGNLGKSIFKEINEKALCEGDEKVGISVKCYRDNFFATLKKNAVYLPKLYEFINKAKSRGDDNAIMELLKRTEYFARECALESRPMKQRDMNLVVAGLLNIEATLLHFDQDQDNELNYAELDRAFPVYKSAIIAAAELSPGTEFLARSIFFYLIKYQKLPSTAGIFAFHARFSTFGDEKIRGDRVTIATLLKYISSMSAVEDPTCKP